MLVRGQFSAPVCVYHPPISPFICSKEARAVLTDGCFKIIIQIL